MTDISTYLEALEEYNKSQSPDKLRDIKGRYFFPDDSGNIKVIIPPKYTQTEERVAQLKIQEQILNGHLEFQRNTIALKPEKNPDEIRVYNDQCERITQIESSLVSNETQDPILSQSKEEIAALREQRDSLYSVNLIDGQLRYSGTIPQLWSQLKSLHSDIETLIPIVFPEDPPDKLFEVEINNLPETESGQSLRVQMQEWLRLNSEYLQLSKNYSDLQDSISDLKTKISDLETSQFRLGSGSQPEIKTISDSEFKTYKSELSEYRQIDGHAEPVKTGSSVPAEPVKTTEPKRKLLRRKTPKKEVNKKDESG